MVASLFDFLRKPGMQSPSAAVRRALESDNLPPGVALADLGVVESRGVYDGRAVTFIRVFDPASAVLRSLDVFTDHAYRDFNTHPDLVLRAGFVERDGTVVMYARPSAADLPIAAQAEKVRLVPAATGAVKVR